MFYLQNGIDEAFDFDVSDINNDNTDNELAAFIESSRQFMEDDDVDSGDESQHILDEFETYKRNYYMSKLNQNDMNRYDINFKTKNKQILRIYKLIYFVFFPIVKRNRNKPLVILPHFNGFWIITIVVYNHGIGIILIIMLHLLVT